MAGPAGRSAERVLVVPRVDVGAVTLQRAAWIAPYRLVPARAKGETDAAYLLRLRGWLRANRMPDRCFVQAVPASGPSARQKMTKTRKPLYVDFGNWFLCAVFERLLAQPVDSVVFREALPLPEDAIGPNVTEVVIELTEHSGG